jgi:hypothetical protein
MPMWTIRCEESEIVWSRGTGLVWIAGEKNIRPKKWAVLPRGCYDLLHAFPYFHTKLVNSLFASADQLSIVTSQPRKCQLGLIVTKLVRSTVLRVRSEEL